MGRKEQQDSVFNVGQNDFFAINLYLTAAGIDLHISAAVYHGTLFSCFSSIHIVSAQDRFDSVHQFVIRKWFHQIIIAAQLLNLALDQICPWLLLVIAAAFISPFHMKKPNTVGKIILVFCGFATLALVLIGVRV